MEVVILSHGAFNQVPGWRSVIVVPCTTSERQAARGPTAVRLAGGAISRRHDSFALCHQVTTLDRSKLTERIGSLADTDLEAIERGLRAAIDLGGV